MVARDASQAQLYPINTLKYVNRQLYRETAGLEVKSNRVVFESCTPNEATKDLFAFMSRCTPMKRSWFGAVALEENATREEGDKICFFKTRHRPLVEIARFCANNPSITFDLRVPGRGVLNQAGEMQAFKFLGAGLLPSLNIQGRDLTDIAPEDRTTEITRLRYARKGRRLMGKHLRTVQDLRDGLVNLHLLPMKTEWDSDTFRDSAMETWNRITPSPHTLPAAGGPEVWLEYARHWTHSGI